MKTPSILTHECGKRMHAGLAAVWINTEQTPSIATVSKQEKSSCQHFSNNRLSGSQLSSRWDKNVLSFKPFCSTGAAHQFSHLHSRGDKELAGKFIFASGYTVPLSLYQPEMKQGSKAPRSFWRQARAREYSRRACWVRQSVLPDPPSPLPTLLNPILCYRLEKSIWSKSQAQREMLKCCNTFWSGLRFWSTQRIPSGSLHN